MLVRLADSVSVVRAERPCKRAPRALPGSRTPTGPSTACAHEEPPAGYDARTARQAIEAYRAVDLVQPRPGLYLHVQA